MGGAAAEAAGEEELWATATTTLVEATLAESWSLYAFEGADAEALEERPLMTGVLLYVTVWEPATPGKLPLTDCPPVKLARRQGLVVRTTPK